MALKWFYHAPGQGRVGPLSADEMRDVYRERRIQPDTLVWRDGLREWQPLERVSDELDLLSITPDASLPPPMPPGAASVAAPAYAAAPNAGHAARRSAPPPPKSGMSGCLIAVLVVGIGAVVIGGILAAIALPEYKVYTIRSKLARSVDAPARNVEQALMQAQVERGRCPTSLDEAGIAGAAGIDVGSVDGRCAFQITVAGVDARVDGKTVVHVAPSEPGGSWDCTGGTLPNRYRRPECKSAAGDAP